MALTSLNLEDVPIFVISLDKDVDRRERVLKRLAIHGLVNQTTVVPAVWKTDSIIGERLNGWRDPRPDYPITEAEVACMQSHLKALRTFLDLSSAPYAMIMEDDCILHNDFRAEYEERMNVLEDAHINFPSLVMLSYYKTTMDGWSTVADGIGKIYPGSMNTLCFLVSRKYAQECLNIYDKKYVDINSFGIQTRLTAEAITIGSHGYFFTNILCIEESWSTNIQGNHSNKWHLDYYRQSGPENFLGADVLAEHVSLLEYWGYPREKWDEIGKVYENEYGGRSEIGYTDTEEREEENSESVVVLETPVSIFADLGDRLQILKVPKEKSMEKVGVFLFRLATPLIC